MKVLVAEDEPNILAGIVEFLRSEGYTPLAASDGEAAIALFRDGRPDFVCLDIMMPKVNGYEVLRQIRAIDRGIPVMFLSAKAEEIDRVLGLELGADDYMLKPFGVRELGARIRAIARRCLASVPAQERASSFFMGALEVLPSELRARRGFQVIELSLREVRILEIFHERPNQVLGRELLFRECWGVDHFANSRTLDQQISKLRKKIEEDPRAPAIIKTVHGVGYRFDP